MLDGKRMSGNMAALGVLVAGLMASGNALAEGFHVGAGWMDDFARDCTSGCTPDLDRETHGPAGMLGFQVGDRWVYGAELFVADGARGLALGAGHRFGDLVTLRFGYMLGQERADLKITDPEGGTDAQFHGPFVEADSDRAMAWLPLELDSSLFLRIGQLEGKATRSQQTGDGPDAGEQEIAQRYDYVSATLGVRLSF